MTDVIFRFRHLAVYEDVDGSSNEIRAEVERIVCTDNLNAKPVKKDSVHQYEDFITGAFDYVIDIYGAILDGDYALALSGKASGNADDESSDPTEFTLLIDFLRSGQNRYYKKYDNCAIVQITDEISKKGYLIQHMRIVARKRTITTMA